MPFGKILVTGGTGFVGSKVVEACKSAGFDVRSCSRSEGVDLRDGDAFGQFLRRFAPDYIVHCAAHVGGIGYVRDHAVDVFEDNLAIATGLLRGMRDAGVGRLLTVMPNCTYPGHKTLYREDEWWDGPIHESVLMYGLPRKVLWGLCKTYATMTDLRSAHLIFPNMYGPGDHFEPVRSHALGALVAKIVAASKTGQTQVEIWGSGQPVREWMYVQDAADAVVRFVTHADQDESVLDDHPIFNVGIAEGITIADLAELIREAVGWDGSFLFNRDHADGALRKLLDGTRFTELTGWRPSTSLRDGIRQTVASYQRGVMREPSYAH